MLSNNSTVETHSYSIITHNESNSPPQKKEIKEDINEEIKEDTDEEIKEDINEETNKKKEDIFQMDKNEQQPENQGQVQEQKLIATDDENTELSSSFIYSVKRKPFIIDPKYIQKYKLKNTCKETNTEKTNTFETENINKTSIYLSKITLGVSFLGMIAISYYRWAKD